MNKMMDLETVREAVNFARAVRDGGELHFKQSELLCAPVGRRGALMRLEYGDLIEFAREEVQRLAEHMIRKRVSAARVVFDDVQKLLEDTYHDELIKEAN